MSAVTVRLVGRRRSFPILVVGLIVYTIMVGASASVVRASIMGILTLLAIYLGRQALAVNSLFVAGLIMTALDPGTLFDIGFQLSFAATLGLVVYAKPFADSTERLLMRLFPNQIARTIVNIANDAILVTFAAQVATLPLLIVYFRQFSWVSLFVNPLVLPAQTGVMVFGLLALTTGLISLPFGQIVGWLAWVFLAWTTGVIHVFASMPNAAIPMDTVDPIWPLLYYALLIGLTGYLRQPKAQRPKAIAEILAPRQLILLGGMTAVLLGVAFSWQPDNKLHIIALDVDSHPIFVRTPKGQQILIGGSNSPSALLGALGQQLPFWDHDLDLIIVPQANASQLNGLLAVLDRYRVKQIVSVKVPTDNRAGREWQAALNKYGLQAGDLQPIDVEPGIKIDFDGSVALIESNGSVISIGSSDLAQINLITTLIDRMPRNAEQVLMICETCQGTDAFAELVKDQRAIDLSNHGNVDLSIDGSDVSINVER
jgi:competence protein ComEC